MSPPKSGENYSAPGIWVGGWMDLRDGMATMSLDGTSSGVALRGLDATGLRTVIYVGIFPNLLLSLHPDYVMVHRMIPLAPNRTQIECTWAFAPESLAQPGFDPGYAIEFWDITNRQDWHACESVQRGLVPRTPCPGPCRPTRTRSTSSSPWSPAATRASAPGPRASPSRPADPGRGPVPGAQASAAGPRLTIWPAMIARWTSLVPSQIRSTRSSR